MKEQLKNLKVIKVFLLSVEIIIFYSSSVPVIDNSFKTKVGTSEKSFSVSRKGEQFAKENKTEIVARTYQAFILFIVVTSPKNMFTLKMNSYLSCQTRHKVGTLFQ